VLEYGADDDVLLVRCLKDLPPADLRARYPQLVSVQWRFADTGFPDEDMHEQIFAFEDRIFAALADERVAVEAASITGRGQKEWRFFARETGMFVDAFNIALTGFPALPLEIESVEDPDWTGLSTLQPPA
jgi:hypothetical protein